MYLTLATKWIYFIFIWTTPLIIIYANLKEKFKNSYGNIDFSRWTLLGTVHLTLATSKFTLFVSKLRKCLSIIPNNMFSHFLKELWRLNGFLYWILVCKWSYDNMQKIHMTIYGNRKTVWSCDFQHMLTARYQVDWWKNEIQTSNGYLDIAMTNLQCNCKAN
mgnify:CR=1 FL=1